MKHEHEHEHKAGTDFYKQEININNPEKIDCWVMCECGAIRKLITNDGSHWMEDGEWITLEQK